MTAARTAKAGKIDELIRSGEGALERDRFFEAERLAEKALGHARGVDDFERMIRIVPTLRAARRRRLELALECGGVTILDEAVTEDMDIDPGCYLVQPPLVGADARRLRLAGREREIALTVICREPLTQLRLVPIVAIGPGATVRVKVDPPDDPEAPSQEWLLGALEELGDWAVASIDPEIEPPKRTDILIDRLVAIPDHDGLHTALEETCGLALELEKLKAES